MPFTPNDYVLDQLLTLVELWKDRTTSEEDDLQDEDTSDNNKKLPTSLPTKKFLKLIKGGLTKELLIKYWENIPALQELIEKPNFNEITLKANELQGDETGEMPPDQEQMPPDQMPPDQMPPDQTQIPGEEPLGQPTSEVPTDQGQLPSADLTGPAAPVEPPVPTGPTPKDIVSAMAKRRKDRVMEQARRSLRNSRSML